MKEIHFVLPYLIKPLNLIPLLCCVVCLASCSGGTRQHYINRMMATPKRALSLHKDNANWSSYSMRTRYDYSDESSATYFRSVYDNATTDAVRMSVRNKIVKELSALIDENHAIYHESLRKTLTTNDVFWDFLTLGLTSSGAIATGAQATRALSAIATGTNGFGGKINGRVLQGQTLATVLKATRIRKEQAYARMQVKFDKPTTQYDLEDVIMELGHYWEAGLLTSGIQQLDEMTNKTLNEVDRKKNEAEGNQKKEAQEVLKVVNPKGETE